MSRKHPLPRDEGHTNPAAGNSNSLLFGIATLSISLLALLVSFWQGYVMRQAMRVDERPWVSVPIPAAFPLNGTSISVVVQTQNTGKTPATRVEGDYVATVLKKGEQPELGAFGVGHTHNHLYLGTVFPNSPIPTPFTVVRYGPFNKEVIVPDDALRQDIANGNRFIIFYGKITYYDPFGTEHWTQFCTGSGSAVLENLKECIAYNDVDHN